MSRRTLFAALAFALALVAVSAAPAKRPPPPPPSSGGGGSGPTNLRITSSSDYSLSLAWDAAKGGSANWWYCVLRDGLGCYRVDPPQTTISFSKLWPGRTTTYTVITVDVNGNRSAPSNSVTHTTPPDTTPPSPAPVVSLQNAWPTRIMVSWTLARDELTQTWHDLYIDGVVHFEAFLTPWTIFYLDPESTHTFQVKARDYFGNTVESSVLSVTTPPKTDNVAPTPPTNLQFSFETARRSSGDLEPVQRRQRLGVADPLRDVPERGPRAGRRRRRHQHDRVLPGRGPDDRRAESGRHVREPVGAEQRAEHQLLTAPPRQSGVPAHLDGSRDAAPEGLPRLRRPTRLRPRSSSASAMRTSPGRCAA
jgi:hypothetical protein